MSDSILNSPISCISGVGKVKKEAYARLGVYSIDDLLHFYPRAYENRGNVVLLCEAEKNIKNSLILTVATTPRVHLIKRGMSLLKFRAFDDSASCEVVFFNQDYLRDKFLIGQTFRFYGKVEEIKGKYTLSSPAYEPYTESISLPPFIPIYKQTDGLSSKQISEHVAYALSVAKDVIHDSLPCDIKEKRALADLYDSIYSLHKPSDRESLEQAKKRLIFDEFFTFALGMSMSSRKDIYSKNAPAFENTDISPLLKLLPYTLTNAQSRAISEIADDMKKPNPMSRILIGDVGSGKTICAAAAMYICVKNGKQACLMAPTEILATQHYNDLSPLFSSLGIKCALLTGSMSPTKKSDLQALIASKNKDERIDIVIGTQALISEKVEFACPGLNIADEQHRFGVNQRAILRQKAKQTHTLVMSATPIPRSLALVMYGDLSVSKLDEMPKGRQRVDTFCVDESYRSRLDAFIEKQANEGSQVYIVCPAVEEKELEDDEIDLYGIFDSDTQKKPPLKAAVEYASELSSRLKNLNIAFVHGKMKPSEKDAVMEDFAKGNIQVLVSTTVIEVGVNVPNATLMIVENAERFGLSQLHQLRGRVGRGSKKAYCVLVCGVKSKNMLSQSSKTRLETMCNCYNGFEIAEQDLKLRGPGDFLCMSNNSNIRQSGDVYFKLADMCDDSGLMNEAFSDAKELIIKDPELREHKDLMENIEKMFTLRQDIIS